MTAILEQSTQVDTPNKHLLVQKYDEMITYLVERYRLEEEFATLAVRNWWDRMVTRLATEDAEFAKEHTGEDDASKRRWAERVLDQTVGLVVCFGSHLHDRFAPSKLVDNGWHLWQLYTLEAEAFEMVMFGRRVHHTPADIPGYDYQTHGLMAKAVAAMRAMDLAVDNDLWRHAQGDCNDCYSIKVSYYDGAWGGSRQ